MSPEQVISHLGSVAMVFMAGLYCGYRLGIRGLAGLDARIERLEATRPIDASDPWDPGGEG